MRIITPQDPWLQLGPAQGVPTQFCFEGRDDDEAVFTAHVLIQHQLLPQLPPQVVPQLKLRLLRDIPVTLCPRRTSDVLRPPSPWRTRAHWHKCAVADDVIFGLQRFSVITGCEFCTYS